MSHDDFEDNCSHHDPVNDCFVYNAGDSDDCYLDLHSNHGADDHCIVNAPNYFDNLRADDDVNYTFHCNYRNLPHRQRPVNNGVDIGSGAISGQSSPREFTFNPQNVASSLKMDSSNRLVDEGSGLIANVQTTFSRKRANPSVSQIFFSSLQTIASSNAAACVCEVTRQLGVDVFSCSCNGLKGLVLGPNGELGVGEGTGFSAFQARPAFRETSASTATSITSPSQQTTTSNGASTSNVSSSTSTTAAARSSSSPSAVLTATGSSSSTTSADAVGAASPSSATSGASTSTTSAASVTTTTNAQSSASTSSSSTSTIENVETTTTMSQNAGDVVPSWTGSVTTSSATQDSGVISSLTTTGNVNQDSGSTSSLTTSSSTGEPESTATTEESSTTSSTAAASVPSAPTTQPPTTTPFDPLPDFDPLACGGGLKNCGIDICIFGNCESRCKDVKTDGRHCGACYNHCGEGECSNGICGCPTAGDTLCGASPKRTCSSLQTDNRNCGCRDLRSSNDSCGSCGNTCGDGGTCSNGQCQCPAPESNCRAGDSNYCAKLDYEHDNCGTWYFTPSSADPHSSPARRLTIVSAFSGFKCRDDSRCLLGNCYKCPPEKPSYCSGPGAGGCTDLRDDRNNCAAAMLFQKTYILTRDHPVSVLAITATWAR
ncbi:unnamed protein product [Zymoseptoria tritici ST99CH_1A5]|uniref:Uncharacterized protein n=1 Tax=Zymoseptoria tritici ST99CH_1A5 TaxID=1276529 RepID=A0A1Y6LH58_ZYMTR|nr:unnamed protein product [Zymoseptoria tritici ST99CH_1A5]